MFLFSLNLMLCLISSVVLWRCLLRVAFEDFTIHFMFLYYEILMFAQSPQCLLHMKLLFVL